MRSLLPDGVHLAKLASVRLWYSPAGLMFYGLATNNRRLRLDAELALVVVLVGTGLVFRHFWVRGQDARAMVYNCREQ